jgi:hypothetical protein
MKGKNMSKQLKNDTPLTAGERRTLSILREFGFISTRALSVITGTSLASAGSALSATSKKKLTVPSTRVKGLHVLTSDGRVLAGLPSTTVINPHPKYVRHYGAYLDVVMAWVLRYGETIKGEYGLRADERELRARIGTHSTEDGQPSWLIGRALTGEHHDRGPCLRCPDFTGKAPDGSLIVGEIETERKKEEVFERMTTAWVQCERAALALYIVPRDRSDVCSAARRVITKTGAGEKVLFVILEDLLEGKPIPVLDSLFANNGTGSSES